MRRKNPRGFTLVELLTAISVIGLAMAVCLPPIPADQLAATADDDTGDCITVRMMTVRFERPDHAKAAQDLAATLQGTSLSVLDMHPMEDGLFRVAIWAPVEQPLDECTEVARAAAAGRYEVLGITET